MVLTSADEIGGKPTGYTLSEAAHPWKVFRDAGHVVDFASIAGGTPPIDPASEHDEITRQMVDHQNWQVDSALVGRFEFDGFLPAVRFVDEIAVEAEDMDHHPDIDIRFDTVLLTLCTHSEGGITQLDIELAHRAQQIHQRLTGG